MNCTTIVLKKHLQTLLWSSHLYHVTLITWHWSHDTQITEEWIPKSGIEARAFMKIYFLKVPMPVRWPDVQAEMVTGSLLYSHSTSENSWWHSQKEESCSALNMWKHGRGAWLTPSCKKELMGQERRKDQQSHGSAKSKNELGSPSVNSLEQLMIEKCGIPAWQDTPVSHSYCP